MTFPYAALAVTTAANASLLAARSASLPSGIVAGRTPPVYIPEPPIGPPNRRVRDAGVPREEYGVGCALAVALLLAFAFFVCAVT